MSVCTCVCAHSDACVRVCVCVYDSASVSSIRLKSVITSHLCSSRSDRLSGYCQEFQRTGTFADCVSDAGNRPFFRCFTSYDSNWSLNAAMFRRKAALEQVLYFGTNEGSKRRPWMPWRTLAGYGESKYDEQAGFERGMLTDNWGKLHVPICLAYHGIFRHVEVDT